jgi:hypothetical protein
MDSQSSASTVMVLVSDPAAFVAVSVTVYVPGSVYVWLGVAPVPVLPSPKFQLYVTGVSPLTFALKLTVTGSQSSNDCGFAVRLTIAAGSGAGTTSTVQVSVSLLPRLLDVNVTV